MSWLDFVVGDSEDGAGATFSLFANELATHILPMQSEALNEEVTHEWRWITIHVWIDGHLKGHESVSRLLWQRERSNLLLIVSNCILALNYKRFIVNCHEHSLYVLFWISFVVLSHIDSNSCTFQDKLVTTCVEEVNIVNSIGGWEAFHNWPRAELMTLDTVEDISTKSTVFDVHFVVNSSIFTAIVFIRNEKVPEDFRHLASLLLLFSLHLVQLWGVGIFTTLHTCHLIGPFHKGLAP